VKPLCRVSVLVSFAAVLFFLPSAFGLNTANSKLAGSGPTVRNFEPSNFLAFAFTSGEDFFKDNKDNKDKKDNGCNASGQKWGNNCSKALPEGGTSVMYLLLAGLACLGGMALRSRREVSIRQTD
jgi:hypothetical protein